MRRLSLLWLLLTPAILAASAESPNLHSATWIVPVVEMGLHPADGEEMWAEVAMENRGRSAVTVDWIVRHADGRRHPATTAGTVIAPGETHTMKAVSEENGPMEYGWARITAHSKDRPRLKITAWAYGLDGDKLTRYSRTVTPGKDMDRSFLMAWKNGEEGRRLYAINDTPEDTPVEICYGRATITTKRIFRSSRTTMRCDEKEEFPVPAGGTRVRTPDIGPRILGIGEPGDEIGLAPDCACLGAGGGATLRDAANPVAYIPGRHNAHQFPDCL
jgi:hypothetical protein